VVASEARSATSAPAPRPSVTPTLTPSSTATFTPTATLTVPADVPPSLSGQIAFPRFDPIRGTYDLYVCQVDGSKCRQVSTEVSQPDFLPDGNQLVAHSWKSDAKGLIVVTLSGQLIWQITDQVEAARPSVNPQDDAYVFESRQESDRQPRLFSTFGTENRLITRGGSPVVGQSPSWLPDKRILYSGCWQNDCGIIVMRQDGTHPRQVVAGSTEANAEASPDGQHVALMSLRDGNWEVYIANLDGSHLQRLTHGPANDGLPTWSPDGQYIAFVTDRDGPWAVWAMRPDGSGQRRLFDIGGPLDGRVRNAAWYETSGWAQERISWAP
jgi:TolB protein